MSKEILCRIDPEDLVRLWDLKPKTMRDVTFIRDYLQTYAVPENQASVLFGGVEEVAKALSDGVKGVYVDPDYSKVVARALLDRFGIPWDKAPEWAVSLGTVWIGQHPGQVDDYMTIPRPAPSLEERRERARKLLETADDELLKRLGV